MSDTPVSATAAPTATPITVNGGDGPVSFDELEAVEASAKQAKRQANKEIKEVVKETVKAGDKNKDQKDEDSLNPGEKKPADNKAEKTAKEKQESVAKAEKAKQLLKAKLADKEFELDADTIIPIKINGRDELLSIKELQSQYSGKVAYDKKFSEMDRERKMFEAKINQANEKIKAIFDEEDPEIRFYKMAELSQQDPIAVRKKFLEDNMKLLEKYYSMTDDERAADAIAYENRIMKHQLESKTREENSRKSQADLERQINQLGKTHQFETKDFWTKYDEAQNLAKTGNLLDHQGKPIKITPEFVSEMVVKDRLWSSAANILDNVENSLPQELRGEFLLDVTDTAFSLGLHASEVQGLVEEMLKGSSQAKIISEKIEEQEELRTGKKGTKKPDYKGDNEVFFFGDIM